MSLLVLLTSGRSLVAIHSGSRYHMNSQRLLPRFDVKKNPFRATTFPRPAPLERVSLKSALELPLAPSPVETAPAAAQSAAVAPVAPDKARAAGAAPRRVVVRLAPRAALLGVATRAWKALTGLLAWRSRKLNEPVRAAVKGPVQGELSLDNVKVLRNDLSDSDLEILPVRASAAVVVTTPVVTAPAAPAVPVAPRAEALPPLPLPVPAGEAAGSAAGTKRWNRLGSRLLSAMRL